MESDGDKNSSDSALSNKAREKTADGRMQAGACGLLNQYFEPASGKLPQVAANQPKADKKQSQSAKECTDYFHTTFFIGKARRHMNASSFL